MYGTFLNQSSSELLKNYVLQKAHCANDGTGASFSFRQFNWNVFEKLESDAHGTQGYNKTSRNQAVVLLLTTLVLSTRI